MSVAKEESVRECGQCGLIKSLVAFATYRGRDNSIRRRGICKDCRDNLRRGDADMLKAWRREHNASNRSVKRTNDYLRKKEVKDYVDKIKSETPCTDCHRFFPPVAMDFDHVRGNKARNIASFVASGYKLDLIKEEIEKCDLVCACCHRIRTAARKENNAPQIKLRGAKAEDLPPLPIVRTVDKWRLVRGSKNAHTDLSELNVLSIRQRVSAGESVSKLAQEFSITYATAYKIITGETWKHVAMPEGGIQLRAITCHTCGSIGHNSKTCIYNTEKRELK